MKQRSASLAGLIALGLLAPAAAQAATLGADRSCYGPAEEIRLTGTGFTPGGSVAVTADGRQLGILTSDATGAIAGSTAAPNPDGKQQTFTYTATDQANLSLVATTPVRVTSLDVEVTPRRGNPAKPRRIRARGFTRGRTLWAHVRRGSKKRNVRVGRLKGACGTIDVRRRVFAADAPSGVYEVRFDTRRRYSTDARPQVMFLVTVFQTFRAASLSSRAGAGELWSPVR